MFNIGDIIVLKAGGHIFEVMGDYDGNENLFYAVKVIKRGRTKVGNILPMQKILAHELYRVQ